ncbi:hypothetical protein ACWD25_09220 [Streptomyces sp. NPDC002920]
MPAGQRHHGVLGGDRDTDETAQPGGGRGRIGGLDHEPGEVVVTAVASAAAVGVANSGALLSTVPWHILTGEVG